MSAFFRTPFNRPLSPEERPYIQAARRGKARPVIVFGKWYASVAEAARATKNSRQLVHYWLRSKKSTRAQYA